MKKYFVLLAVLMVMSAAGAAFSFDSSDVYVYGRNDREHTMAIAGVALTKGQWVVYADSRVVAARASDAGTTYETCSVVMLTATENYGPCAGIVESSVDTGALVRILTRGWCDYAKVDGVDSGSVTTGAAIMQAGTALSITAKSGYAGAASALLTTVSAAPVGTQVCGFLLEPVTGRATSAAFADTSTSYAVYVTTR